MAELPRIFREQAYSLFDSLVDRLHAEASDYSESPIEALFSTAFLVLGHTHYGETALAEPAYERDTFPDRFDWILSFQHRVDRYRVDFMVSPNPRRPSCCVIVECDGHNFHERTKEQAARDRSRDRELQVAGFKVFRFTGQELYRDAFKCASEVYEELLRQLDEEGVSDK